MRCLSSPTWKAPKAVPLPALHGACRERPGSQGLSLSEEPWGPLGVKLLILSVLKGWRRMQGFLAVSKS